MQGLGIECGEVSVALQGAKAGFLAKAGQCVRMKESLWSCDRQGCGGAGAFEVGAVFMVLEAEVSPVSSPDALRGVCPVVRQRGGSDDGHDGELA
jgi:hypothetical protein